ncbi:hypothetical protein HETIRDRAFT_163875 [Heterobasidion irregulare TC 32-1]|uniref:Uncharacterized protein n=1 Tax=Heterobasidion irregulare (strain TC 32-1) TaxID=747525 RepID=W4JWG0_HETIT|nr:uncharacterized protein HETIRDRAFT_163875 [Heterobasidion irregulare TC 32-1]ETW77903.1 hypothetical protein HETIRDRAFT_163875 [Heterobasidion irregulare TC 32-1]
MLHSSETSTASVSPSENASSELVADISTMTLANSSALIKPDVLVTLHRYPRNINPTSSSETTCFPVRWEL